MEPVLSCIIIDDEQHAIDVIKNYMRHVPYLQVQGTYTNPIAAMAFLHTTRVDVIFLDIHMPEISGIDFMKNLENKTQRVIFTTAYSEFAVEGFTLDAVDYLLKPIPLPRFLNACQRAVSIIKGPATALANKIEDDYIFVKTDSKGKMLKINFADIDYIEGMKNYVAIYHNGNKTITLLNLKDLEGRLPIKYFIRIQKSFIISLRKVTGIQGNVVRLEGIDADITIGETYKAGFMDRLHNKLMK